MRCGQCQSVRLNMNDGLPKSLRQAQKRGIEYFQSEDCEWKLECMESAKFIKEMVGCDVSSFANNGFGDYLFLKKKSNGDGFEEEVFEFFHEGPEINRVRGFGDAARIKGSSCLS